MPWGSPHPASGTVWHAGRVPCTGRGRVGKTAYPLKMITRRGLAALGSMGRLGCVVCASAIFLTTASVAHQLGGSVPAMTTSEVAEAVLGPPNAEESDWGGLFVMVTTRDCADCRVVQYELALLATALRDDEHVSVATVAAPEAAESDISAEASDEARAARVLLAWHEKEGAPAFRWFAPRHGAAAEPGTLSAVKYDGEPAADAIVRWLKSQLRDSGTPLRAEPSSVLPVTARGFATLRKSKKRDAAVMLYAAWSAPCAAAAPAWELLGDAMKHEDGVEVAKLDLDSPGAEAIAEELRDDGGRLPRVLFLHAGTRANETYSGPLDATSLVNWVNELAGTHRSVGAGLTHRAGRIAEIDAVARKWPAATLLEKEELLGQASLIAREITEGMADDAPLVVAAREYIQLMRASWAIGRPVEFLGTEKARVKRKLAEARESGARAHADHFQRRLNVLEVLQPTPVHGLGEGGVVQITGDEFESIVDGRRAALVAFTAPWCGHSKALKPRLDDIAARLHAAHADGVAATHGETGDSVGGIVIAEVDATHHVALSQRYGVRAFPTLLFWPEGADAADVPTPFDGDRSTANGIADWLTRRVRGLRWEPAESDAVAGTEL